MSVTGTWNLTVKAPTGAMETLLELREEAGQLAGSQTGQGVTNDIQDGRIDGDNLSWVTVTTRPMKMKLEFNGTVAGDAITGKVKAGMMGSYPFTASKA